MHKTLSQILDEKYKSLPKDFVDELYSIMINRIAKPAMNLKHRNIYLVIGLSIDCTNSREGLINVLYINSSSKINIFTRELREFHEKFMLLGNET